jgi:ketosteroid isomerase-like protein
MKRLLAAAFLVAVVALAFGCSSQPKAPDIAAMAASADSLNQAFVDAFNRGDVDAVASMYWNSPEVVLFPPDTMECKGFEEVHDGYARMFAAMKGAHLELTETHDMPAGDVVVSWGLWRLTGTGPDGKPMVTNGRFTDVKGERDGRWVYLVDHISLPLPPMPPPAPAKGKKGR